MSNEQHEVKAPDSVISPEASAYISASIKSAITEVFASLAPHLSAMALTPEKIREANRPVITPEAIALKLREERESLKSREDEAEVRRQTEFRQKNCPHKDKNLHSSINLVHNSPDRMVRGICVLCHSWIAGKHWEIAATEEEAAKHGVHKGKAYIAEAHPCYDQVLQLESMA